MNPWSSTIYTLESRWELEVKRKSEGEATLPKDAQAIMHALKNALLLVSHILGSFDLYQNALNQADKATRLNSRVIDAGATYNQIIHLGNGAFQSILTLVKEIEKHELTTTVEHKPESIVQNIGINYGSASAGTMIQQTGFSFSNESNASSVLLQLEKAIETIEGGPLNDNDKRLLRHLENAKEGIEDDDPEQVKKAHQKLSIMKDTVELSQKLGSIITPIVVELGRCLGVG